MKLLLTSAGLTNKSIIDALAKLKGKPLEESNLVFVPTAANVEEDDKSWMIKDLLNCQKQNFAKIDIIDFTSLPLENWLPRFKQADILLFGGGNTQYLNDSLKKFGLDKLLPELLETRVYVGISAGSMVASKKLDIGQYEKLYSEKTEKWQNDKGLGFVDFQILPHLNSAWFPNLNLENIKKVSKEINEQVYALDDQSTLVVNEDAILMVSEGEWEKFN